MEALSFDDLLKILYMYKVRVNGDKLIVSGGSRFPNFVRASISIHKTELLRVYADENLLQEEIDDIEQKAQEADKSILEIEKASDLWRRWVILTSSRKANLPKPWATVPEDSQRCSFCPNLGKPAQDDIICDHKCEPPY